MTSTMTGNPQDHTTPSTAALVLTHDAPDAAEQIGREHGEWVVTFRSLPGDHHEAAIFVEQALFDTDPGLVLFVGTAVAADTMHADSVVVAERISVFERGLGPRIKPSKRTRRAGHDLMRHVRRTLVAGRARRRGAAAYHGPLLLGTVAMHSYGTPELMLGGVEAWRQAFPEAVGLNTSGWECAFGYYDVIEFPALAILGLIADAGDADAERDAHGRAMAVAADLLAGVPPSRLKADPLEVTADEGEREHLRGDAEVLPHESTQPIVQRAFPADTSRAQTTRPRHRAKPQVGRKIVNAYIVNDGVPPADLHLIIRQRERSLEFTLHSERPDLPYNMQSVGETPLGVEFGGDPRQYRDNIKAQVRQIAKRPDPGDVQRLRNLGAKLYNDLFPDKLKRAYAEIRDKDVRTLQITSNEPWIPWEMVRPHSQEFPRDDFLCKRFAMTRWLSQGKPKHLFEIGTIASLEAGAVEGQAFLPTAKQECEHIAGLAAQRDVENVTQSCARYEVVEQLLTRNDRDVHLWHVAAHGQLGDDDPDESVIVFKDRKWRAADLAGDSGYAIQRARPLVFFNACLVGQQDYSLARLGGWPHAWVEQNHCGGFLAPQWSVSSKLATEFARVFYEAVIGDEREAPKTLGEAARLAREAVQEQDPIDPAWLSYVVYGHPNARVHFGTRSAAVA